jgi:hypothetical protein
MDLAESYLVEEDSTAPLRRAEGLREGKGCGCGCGCAGEKEREREKVVGK